MEKDYSIEYTNKFLNLYKKLEQLETDEPKKYAFLFSKYKSQLDLFRHIRNDLSHNIINDKYPIIISNDVYSSLNRMLNLVKKKAIDYCTKKKDIIFVNLNSSLKETLKFLSVNNFSHLPIINEKGKVMGVVSNSSMIDIIYKNQNDSKLLEKIVGDFLSEFNLNNEEEFYMFVSQDTFMYELNELLNKRNNKKLGAIFITANGKQDETIVGLVRSWDIIRSLN